MMIFLLYIRCVPLGVQSLLVTLEMSATLSLSDAAKRGDLEEVTRLLQNGANINQRDRVSEDVLLLSFRVYYDCYGQNGYAAIHYAASEGKNEVLKCLLAAGADKEIVANVS